MASDLEKLLDMYARAGIVYERSEGGSTIVHHTLEGCAVEIAVEAGRGDNNFGYVGFSAHHFFDKEGNLLAVGAWE